MRWTYSEFSPFAHFLQTERRCCVLFFEPSSAASSAARRDFLILHVQSTLAPNHNVATPHSTFRCPPLTILAPRLFIPGASPTPECNSMNGNRCYAAFRAFCLASPLQRFAGACRSGVLMSHTATVSKRSTQHRSSPVLLLAATVAFSPLRSSFPCLHPPPGHTHFRYVLRVTCSFSAEYIYRRPTFSNSAACKCLQCTVVPLSHPTDAGRIVASTHSPPGRIVGVF